MLADLATGGQVGLATFNTVNDFLVENVRIPVIKSREEDNNNDGVTPTILLFALQLRK